MNPEIIGYLAAFLTTASYVPQLVKVLRHRHTKSISLGMYITLTLGIAMWFAYGVMIDSPSIMVANAATFLMSGAILLIKLRYG